MAKKAYPKQHLVLRDTSFWHHRIEFLKSFENEATQAVAELRDEVFAQYAEVRRHFTGIFGIAMRELERGGVFANYTFAMKTPFALFHTLTLQDQETTEPKDHKLLERIALSKTLLKWSEKWKLSPMYWQGDEWFLDRVMVNLATWYHAPEKGKPILLWSGLAWQRPEAKVEIRVAVQEALTWDLVNEDKATFKKRMLQEIDQGLDNQLDKIYAQLIESAEKAGFTRPERRHDYARDMGWLVRYHCLGKSWEELAELLPPEKSMDTVRKAVERRARDVELTLRTKM